MTIQPLWPDQSDLDKVHLSIKQADPDGRKFASAIRRTYDMLLDGVNTGRYRWDQLRKTEKTHCGTLVEINLQRRFEFPDGKVQDYLIEGVEVDCKFSKDYGRWMIPPEAVGHILLVVWANDEQGQFSAGLVRAEERLLTQGKGNRDHKRNLTPQGIREVLPIFMNGPLPDNILLRLSKEDETAIFLPSKGQPRINELFRRVQQRRIGRTAIATVAMQADYMKRVRYSGGARSHLAPEGIIILGQFDTHQEIARQLGISVPGRGEFVSIRVTPRQVGRPWVYLDEKEWSVAVPGDPIIMAPKLPTPNRRTTGEDEVDF